MENTRKIADNTYIPLKCFRFCLDA